MKSNSNIFLALLLSIAFVSCSSSEENPKPEPNPGTENEYQQYGSPFDKVAANEDAVIYQVNVRSFSPEGNLKGVQKRLGDIQKLGANVIYLMPIYPVGKIKTAGKLGSPYSIKDYKAVNSDYGTLEDLRALVTEAHSKNMAVILDWVANHTSWDNQWITAHPDWYQKDASGNITIPPGTNWQDVAQLNYTNAEMKKTMIDAMSYWVYNANIDGFRCDAADFVPMNFWSEAISKIRKIKNQRMILMAEGTRVNHFDAGFDYTFGFAYFGALEKVFSETQPASYLQTESSKEYGQLDASRRIVRYTTNHDVNLSDGTPLELFGGKKGSLAAFVIASSMKSVPMIYNGQEIGYNKRIDYFDNVPIDWSTADNEMLLEYQKIIAFRNSSEALRKGKLTGYSSNEASVFTMETTNEKVLIVANIKNKSIKYTTPIALTNTNWKDALTGSTISIGSEINLEAYQYLILKKE
ncbi:alpha-amylase family glycosyl hydrolase [Flavobacterium sp. CFBP9031]|uniref:alpha-amylase family glycosyl hydrolase n=1 Tax=Flavobacterium sp. CFBP9031 TaxID=3096538 RepID=UPI002A6A64CC|nr:alpha-amylase family glycosyl hydrolase [Flavobacterium sp. CFBP9031]MDY0989203.1 alpha-amylase family glycosyl hydrolase [Flavobacterium sp. CFBP9031]